MQEDFLHFVWRYKKLNLFNLKTVSGRPIEVLQFGTHNHDSGPDFFNAKLKIGDQVWAGNVEMHLKSSDWYAHGHDNDKAYDNVILHVVWKHNKEVQRISGSAIEVLELQANVDTTLVENYKTLMRSKKWVNCETYFSEVDEFILSNWLERLFFERLAKKANVIERILAQDNNNWEYTLFVMLFRTFGAKVNADAFESAAKSISFRVVTKVKSHRTDLEALLFGQLGLLDGLPLDDYQTQLKDRYDYLKHKFKLSREGVLPIKKFRLRPSNFPTIRLAQFSALYQNVDKLFSKLMEVSSAKDIQDLFDIRASLYWDTHYDFGTVSKKRVKKISTAFIHHLIINTVVPIQYMYMRSIDKFESQNLISLLQDIPMEKNTVTKKFQDLKRMQNTAISSQALLQLKHEYCDKNRCLNCAVAKNIML